MSYSKDLKERTMPVSKAHLERMSTLMPTASTAGASSHYKHFCPREDAVWKSGCTMDCWFFTKF